MRAEIRTTILVAALVLLGCADTTSPSVDEKLVLSLSHDSVSVEVGSVVLLSVSVTRGAIPDVATPITWQSSDTRIATVTGAGEVRGIAAGLATISAIASGASARAIVSVTTPAPPPSNPSGESIPELPRARVDVSMPAVTGRSIGVPAGADLQAALDAAQPGDELVLEAGATYTGTFVLRAKSGTGWIIVRSGGSLPPAGTRVTPGDAARLARLVAPNPASPVLKTETSAHHYRLVGLEITAAPGATQGGTLVSLGEGGSSQNTMEQQPHHLVLDRMYIHGTSTLSFQRCVALNSAWTAIVDSWLSECHGKGFDSQAIGGWNGTGPYRIENNRLEGAGENVMFGGADPQIPNALPSDIEILRNHFIKPLEWKGVWSVKNLLEFKLGQRILVEGNIFENCWVDAQTGFAFVFKSTNQSGGAPWSETRDLTVRYNLIRNSAHGISIAAKPEAHPAVAASRMLFEHNILDRIGMGDFPGGRLFQVSGVDDLTLLHNTALNSHSFLILVNSSDLIERLKVENNIFAGSTYGLSGDGAGAGSAALNARAPGWIFKGNVITGAAAATYPANNEYLASTADVGFTNHLAGDYTVSGAHAVKGANVAMLQSKTSGVIR